MSTAQLARMDLGRATSNSTHTCARRARARMVRSARGLSRMVPSGPVAIQASHGSRSRAGADGPGMISGPDVFWHVVSARARMDQGRRPMRSADSRRSRAGADGPYCRMSAGTLGSSCPRVRGWTGSRRLAALAPERRPSVSADEPTTVRPLAPCVVLSPRRRGRSIMGCVVPRARMARRCRHNRPFRALTPRLSDADGPAEFSVGFGMLVSLPRESG
jgi:hypothetical protein